MAEPPADAFLCNVCGNTVTLYAFAEITRETAPCPTCGAYSRLRALTHLVSLELFGASAPVTQWRKKDALIYGISDWVGFERFGNAVTYINTQFDRAQYPDAVYLDITRPAPEMLQQADIVISSEVLEHVPPPAQAAFDGLYLLLKPGGSLIFTVPYSFEATDEHFPNLYDWRIEKRAGKRILVNATALGDTEVFEDLVFHEGGVEVLEMRLFGLPSILEHLSAAGFVDATVMDNDVQEYGIRNGSDWSRAIVARRPGWSSAADNDHDEDRN